LCLLARHFHVIGSSASHSEMVTPAWGPVETLFAYDSHEISSSAACGTSSTVTINPTTEIPAQSA